MKVKRYVVDDLPAAVQMIRNELGSDAVILNTKEIRTGGFLGMFRKKRVEVIAAVDEASRRPSARPPQPVRQSRPSAWDAAAQPKEAEAAKTPVPSQAVRQIYAKSRGDTPEKPPAATAIAEPDMPNASAQSFAEALQQIRQIRQADPESTKQEPDPAPHPPAAAAPAVSRDADEAAVLLQEIRNMKEMMAKMARQQSFSGMPESVLKWSRRLAEQGVDPIHVEQFAEEVRSRLDGNREQDESASYQAAADLLRSWLIPCAGGGIGEGTRIVHFVGPTGVGKTTTIAKLAAEQSFTHRRSVGFITADTYRISAVDQLRTYADILNMPLEVVFSPGELARAYKKLADRDLLFMDTAGRNYRNELFVSEVNSLLAPGEQTETFLVLSMTHKYADMKAVAAQFAKYGVRRLLLTKADETATYGSLINLVREFGFPISYVTCGQTVPDDIRAFDPEEWVVKLLGEPDHE